MIRMSEIIKMGELNERKKPFNADKKEEVLKEKIDNGKEANENAFEDISNVKQKIEESNTEILKLYNDGFAILNSAFNQTRRNEKLDCTSVLNFIKNIVESTIVEDKERLTGFHEITSIEDYLPRHSLNVGFLSAKIGVWLGLNKSELIELSAAGFLHDLGMVKVENIVKKEANLSIWERRKVAKHAEYSERTLRETSNLSEEALAAVKMHHYRGSRHKFSHVIGLADIYEAITHDRIYRRAQAPHKAVEEIIEKESANFQSDVVKAFINIIGVYPIGSWVKLSTGEIGVVIGVNKGYPLRPKVNIIFNHAGEKVRETKILDFMSESYFYIDGPIDISSVEQLKLQWEKQ